MMLIAFHIAVATPFLIISMPTGTIISIFLDITHVHEISLTRTCKDIGLCNDNHPVQFIDDAAVIPLFLAIHSQYQFIIFKSILRGNTCI
jgi:hypothetical protein